MNSLSRREQIYVGVFAVALLWGLWNFRLTLGLGSSTQSPAGTAKTPATAVTAASAPANPQAGATVSPAVARTDGTSGEYSAPDWATDPFHRRWRSTNTVAAEPARARTRTSSPLKLSAIVVRGDVRYAVINGHVVREGDKVEGRTVIRVEPAQVIIDEKGIEVRLSL